MYARIARNAQIFPPPPLLPNNNIDFCCWKVTVDFATRYLCSVSDSYSHNFTLDDLRLSIAVSNAANLQVTATRNVSFSDNKVFYKVSFSSVSPASVSDRGCAEYLEIGKQPIDNERIDLFMYFSLMWISAILDKTVETNIYHTNY